MKWIESTNAIGIVTRKGRGGGTYAHKDIAFKFAAWLSAEFELYIGSTVDTTDMEKAD